MLANTSGEILHRLIHGYRGSWLPLRCYAIDGFGSCATTACLIVGKLRNFSPMREEANRSTPYPQNDKSEHQRLVRSADPNRRQSRESTDRRRWPQTAIRTFSTSASVLELARSPMTRLAYHSFMAIGCNCNR